MSVDASYTTARFPRWSSTGNAAARPDACPALHLRSRGSPKPSLNTAHSDPISRSSTHNYKIPRALTASATRCTTVKSP
jgi:hypothetical protein